jgi:hypothetical protein
MRHDRRATPWHSQLSEAISALATIIITLAGRTTLLLRLIDAANFLVYQQRRCLDHWVSEGRALRVSRWVPDEPVSLRKDARTSGPCNLIAEMIKENREEKKCPINQGHVGCETQLHRRIADAK